jgi:hypothetical protein
LTPLDPEPLEVPQLQPQQRLDPSEYIVCT